MSGASKPLYLLAAERQAREAGLTTGDVLERDREKVLSAVYPGPHCLQPEEVTIYLQGRDPSMDARVEEHVRNCSPCDALLEGATSHPRLLEELLNDTEALSIAAAVRASDGIGPPSECELPLLLFPEGKKMRAAAMPAGAVVESSELDED